MSRKVYCLFILLFIHYAFALSSHAANQTVFGPESFEIGNWHIHASAHMFRVEDPGGAVVTVTKNTPDKSINGGFILLNTTAVSLRDFLAGNDAVFEKEITLQPINVVTLFLRGTPGASVTVTIHAGTTPAQPPEVAFSADPQTIALGEPSTLSWNVVNAETISIDHGIGSVDPSGSSEVSPQEATTYTLTAVGPGGTTTADVSITVTNPNVPPAVSMAPAFTSISQGGSITLTWTSQRAQSAFIDNGVGNVPVSGSATVSPEHTTIYTITVTGATGSSSTQAKIQVIGHPAPLPEGSFGKQYEDLIPSDSTVEEYDTKRFSLITGLVRSNDDSPLPDVWVNLHGHPEYGTVSTDAEGRFTLPVEGGTTLTVVYRKDGLITSHRKVYVPWNDISIAETIRMVAQDPASTTVTFDGNPDHVMTHRSTPVTDEFGTRSATMVFTGDNHAYLVDENGDDVQELTTITARATEYTTPESMPAVLPPTSAYTYCAEFSVDGAQRVRFEKPVTIWVDNFLGFDVGMAVPVGYYDRDRGVWVPSDNGTVVKLLDTNSDGIIDALDANGDDQPDDLNSNGSFSDEVKGLNDSAKYPPDSTFWRVAVTHFTPEDCNWPYLVPTDAIPPNPETIPTLDQQQPKEKTCLTHNNSFVEDRSRIFHEDIPIPGTDMTLHYASNRAEGDKTVISVPASGETVPASLKSIIVKVEVAGRILELVLDPLPNQRAEFVWDGLDHLGKPIGGSITAHINVGFLYDAVYSAASNFNRAFAQAGEDITGTLTRQEVIIWKISNIAVYPEFKSSGSIADSWTFSSHHQINLQDLGTLRKGDGTISKNNAMIIETVAGNGQSGYSGDGGPAVDAKINNPYNVAMDALGNLYITNEDRILKVNREGIITTVAGNGSDGYSGDGGPATNAQIDAVAMTFDSLGNLFIASIHNHRIRKVDTNGIIETVAGNGTAGFSDDGGMATQVSLTPTDVAVDAWGNLYFVEQNANRVSIIGPDGIVRTVAGNGTAGYGGDGGPAKGAQLNIPPRIACDNLGNLFIADLGNNCIRKVDRNGIIETVAGNGTAGFSGDGGLATQAELYRPAGVAVDASGNIYIADYLNHRIRRVNTNGIIVTIAGNGIEGFGGDGGIPTEANLHRPADLILDEQNNIYIADAYNARVREIASHFYLMGTDGGSIFFEEGGLGHIISSTGLHKNTIDLDTGALLRGFGYDGNHNLISITDQFGNQTSINWDGDDVPTSITSPNGLTTQLTMDAANHLTRITYPDGSFYSFEYTPDGLMTAEIDPKGNRFDHAFNSAGKLTDATDEDGGHWQYNRTTYSNGNILIEMLTGEGNLTSFRDHTDSTGAYTSTITDPSGAQVLFSETADGLMVNKTLPCGMDLEFKYDLDSEYKFKFVKEMTETSPSGLEKVAQRDKTYQDTNADDIPDLITETVTVNGRPTTFENNVLQSKKTAISPEGRTISLLYNPSTLVTERMSISGLFDTSFGYDVRGRLTSVTANTRQTAFAYTAQGFLQTVTDPGGYTTTYTHDPVGRTTGINRPDGSSIGFAYDKNGNMTVLTNPATINHGFGYNKVNLNSSYQTPLSGSYTYVYDRDRRLKQINFPSGNQINNMYANGRLEQIRTPEGNIDYTYLCSTKVGSITKGSESIAYNYDGKLVTAETLSGTLNQTLGYTYNNDFNLTSLTYAGNTESYIYDHDGLLTGTGNYTISRNAGNGLPEAVSGSSLSLSRTFNGYGEIDAQDYSIGGQYLTSWNLNRDNNGRITNKSETVGGISSDYIYTYDAMGRLLTVTKDNTLVEEYQYNTNGTRIYEMNSLRGIAGRNFSYDNEDHLLIAGSAVYSYNLDGFLTAKTDGSEVTTYDYSSRGELLTVTLPDGRIIDYVYDPLGRRIAKKVDGVITEKYLWQRLTRLLAVYDGSNNLLMRFEYADGRMPMAMTKGGVTYYLTYDQVGSLRVVADASGNVVKRIDYDSFGNIIEDTAPAFEVPFGFAGGLTDRDSGLITFGFRDYDPNTGRWTAKDPILFAGGETDLYGYVLNNPVNWIDPSGQFLATAIVGAIAGGTTGILTGLKNGNIGSAVLGGIAGAIVGAAVGSILPQWSGIAGEAAANLLAGAWGGGIGSAVSAIASPCATIGIVLKSTGEGILTGAAMGGFNAPFTYLAKLGIGAEISATIGEAAVAAASESIATPIRMTYAFISK